MPKKKICSDYSSLILEAVIPQNRRTKHSMLKEEEIDVLLTDLLNLYGYDFNYYSRDSLKRRISKLFRLEKYSSFDQFRERVKSDPAYISHLVDRITVNVTEMFRDPHFFNGLRPILSEFKGFPLVKIWHAGCASGEEAYSMAILLHEAGILHKTEITATDINPLVLNKARDGVYKHSIMKLFEKNYQECGGNANFFEEYFINTEKESKIKPFLAEKIFFTEHNLASDIHLKGFNLIVCRNVVIYFDSELRLRVFNLFDSCLLPEGYLALGEKESLPASALKANYSQLGKEKIWKKLQ